MEIYIVLLHSDYGDGKNTSIEEVFANESDADKYVDINFEYLNAHQWFEVIKKEVL